MAHLSAMERKERIDGIGAFYLVSFAVVLAFNQVVIKLGNGGFQPVFMAAMRSVLALLVLMVWMRLRGIPMRSPRGTWGAGLLIGGLFSFEFVALFWALDHTSVARASILFYSMPVMLSLAAHFFLPAERLTPMRSLGLALAMGGVALVLAERQGGEASLMGDLAALAAAAGWGGIALSVRVTRAQDLVPEVQLLWQLVVSSVVLGAVAPLFGEFFRDPGPWHWAGLGYQAIAVASFGFLFWFFLMKRYPASGVASFSFLSPVISVLLGWLVLDERVGPNVFAALVLVAIGIVLINRRPRVAG